MTDVNTREPRDVGSTSGLAAPCQVYFQGPGMTYLRFWRREPRDGGRDGGGCHRESRGEEGKHGSMIESD